MQRILISVVLFALCLYGLKVYSADPITTTGHSIKQLKVVTQPKAPRVGNTVDSLTLTFKLKSTTGISKNRIKVLVNDQALSIDGTNITLTKSTDNDDEDVDVYNVEIKLLGLTFSQTSNEIKVQYLLSSISPETIKAQNSITLVIQSSGNSGSGNGGSGSGNGGSGSGSGGNNGGVHQAPRLITMLAEVVNGDGAVSSTAQNIRLTIDHDQRLLDIVTEDGFNPKTNIALKKLKITKVDPNDTDDKTDVSDDFVFNLETESVKIDSAAVSKNGQMLRTIYISNGVILNEIAKLKFKIDLTQFYTNSGLDLEDDLITIAKDNILIEGDTAENFAQPSLDDPIVFTLTKTKNGKVTYTSNTTDLRASFTNDNGGIASIRSTKFIRTNSSGSQIKPSILGKNKNHKLRLNINNGSPSVTQIGNGNTSTVTVPVTFTINSTKKELKSGGFFDSTSNKTITIPFMFIGKTTDNLDVLLENTYSEASAVIFNSL